jgi:ABC-type nitrate/sulfonate/bicarbonate transport system substrate-binding protein
MEVGQAVWMVGVSTYGSESPSVYISERKITAVVGDKYVVEGLYYETVIVERGRLYESHAEAAEAATKMLIEARDKTLARYQAKIEEMEKICLHDAAVSV